MRVRDQTMIRTTTYEATNEQVPAILAEIKDRHETAILELPETNLAGRERYKRRWCFVRGVAICADAYSREDAEIRIRDFIARPEFEFSTICFAVITVEAELPSRFAVNEADVDLDDRNPRTVMEAMECVIEMIDDPRSREVERCTDYQGFSKADLEAEHFPRRSPYMCEEDIPELMAEIPKPPTRTSYGKIPS